MLLCKLATRKATEQKYFTSPNLIQHEVEQHIRRRLTFHTNEMSHYICLP